MSDELIGWEKDGVVYVDRASAAPRRANARVVPIPAPLWAMLENVQNRQTVHNPHDLPCRCGHTWPQHYPKLDMAQCDVCECEDFVRTTSVQNPHDLVWHHDDGRPLSRERDDGEIFEAERLVAQRIVHVRRLCETAIALDLNQYTDRHWLAKSVLNILDGKIDAQMVWDE